MDFSWFRAVRSLVFCVVFYCLSFFFWSLYCLSLFYLWLPSTPLLPSKLSQNGKDINLEILKVLSFLMKHEHTFHLTFTCPCLKLRTHYIYIFTSAIIINQNWWTFKTLLQSSKCNKHCICISRYGLWCNVISILSGKRHYQATCVCHTSVYLP